MNKAMTFHLLLAALIMSLCGCSDKSFFGKESDAGVIHAAESSGSKPQRGKPGAAVRLENSQPFYFESPGIINLDLILSTVASTGNMQIDVIPGQGLELLSAQSRFDFVLAHEATYKLPLQISAAREGRFYINLHVGITNGKQRETKVIGAIVQVGALAAAPAHKKQASNADNGDEPGLIELPAQETVSPSQ